MTTKTAAYISTVTPNHTVILPESIPIGAKVAVIMMSPDHTAKAERVRQARFAKVMAAIQAAIASGFTKPNISDAEFDALIEHARHHTKAT